MPEETSSQKTQPDTDPETPPGASQAHLCTPHTEAAPEPPAKGSTDPETPTRPTKQALQPPGVRYQIIQQLGQGGMGRVLGVYDTKQQKTWALKQALHGQEEGLLREKSALDQLRSYAELRGSAQPILCTHWLRGQSLSKALKRDHPRRLLSYVLESALALASAHQRGLVHRDLKPTNLWVHPDGRLCILDWGISAEAGQLPQRSRGTPGFAAPEQLRGEASQPASDVFSLGRILSLIPARTSSLREIRARATQPDLSDRYPDAAAFADALRLAI